MSCPRCGGSFETFTAETTGRSAVICDSCGYTDIAASHHSEPAESESWDQARDRLVDADLPPAATFRTDQNDTTPAADGDTGLDPERLDEPIMVAPRQPDPSDDRENEV